MEVQRWSAIMEGFGFGKEGSDREPSVCAADQAALPVAASQQSLDSTGRKWVNPGHVIAPSIWAGTCRSRSRSRIRQRRPRMASGFVCEERVHSHLCYEGLPSGRSLARIELKARASRAMGCSLFGVFRPPLTHFRLSDPVLNKSPGEILMTAKSGATSRVASHAYCLLSGVAMTVFT